MGAMTFEKMDRSLFFCEQVTQSSIKTLMESIIKINESDDLLKRQMIIYGLEYKPEPIKIFIDSYGGAVYQCFGLLGIMGNSKTPIHTYVTGAAMSCGFLILIHGHKRFAYEHATPLYHQVSSWSLGKLKDIEESYIETKRLQEKIESITLEKTKITKSKLDKIFKRKKDWYMDAKEALKLGVVDEIL